MNPRGSSGTSFSVSSSPASCAVFLLGAVVLLSSPGASAEPSDVAWGRRLVESDRLLGDFGGARSQLERLGVELQLFYNQNVSGKPSGGGANRDGVFGHSGSYDFFALVDLEELAGWRGGDVLLHVKGQYDRNINQDVGALSDPIDDADFDEPIYVDELWFQQSLFDARLRLRFGFSEQQTVFDRNAFANSEDRQFLTSFLDNNAVVPLPNGFAAMLLVEPVPWLDLVLGAADADNRPRDTGFDSAFDGIDSLSGYFEAKLRSPWESHGLPGSYRFGAFVDGRRRTNFRTARRSRGHAGGYLSFDQFVWREKPNGREGLGLFARGGYADPKVNRVTWFWSLGLQYIGVLPGRDADIVGLGAYQAIGSDVYRDEVDPRFDEETGIELYYAIRALRWLVVTPDFQYIFDPGATGAPDAFVGSLRFRVGF